MHVPLVQVLGIARQYDSLDLTFPPPNLSFWSLDESVFARISP